MSSQRDAGVVSGDLKLDFEEIQRVHAQCGDDTRAESCGCMILKNFAQL